MSKVICNKCETVAHCMKNGCVPKQQALNKMADNARELRLNYEQPAQSLVVPDFLTAHDPETPEYRNGWNDCRQLMMEMYKREIK